MADAYVGEIRMFGGSYAPTDWALCDGSLLQIAGNEALYSLIGTTYGGDGSATFGLPDLRGRLPVGQGQGDGRTNRIIGQKGGAETVTLDASTMPAHNHSANAVNSNGNQPGPVTLPSFIGTTWAKTYNTQTSAAVNQYITGPEIVSPKIKGPLDPLAIQNACGNPATGATDAHNNMMPFITLNFIISLSGIYPTRK